MYTILRSIHSMICLAVIVQRLSHDIKGERSYCKIPQGRQSTNVKAVIIAWRKIILDFSLQTFCPFLHSVLWKLWGVCQLRVEKSS